MSVRELRPVECRGGPWDGECVSVEAFGRITVWPTPPAGAVLFAMGEPFAIGEAWTRSEAPLGWYEHAGRWVKCTGNDAGLVQAERWLAWIPNEAGDE